MSQVLSTHEPLQHKHHLKWIYLKIDFSQKNVSSAWQAEVSGENQGFGL